MSACMHACKPSNLGLTSVKLNMDRITCTALLYKNSTILSRSLKFINAVNLFRMLNPNTWSVDSRIYPAHKRRTT